MLTTVAALALGTSGAMAAQTCPDGSEPIKDGGQRICTEEGKNDRFTSTTTGQGNIGNKTSGPVCDGTGSGKCPGGQF
jgi:hypothetical protein